MNLSTQIADLESKIGGIVTVIKGMKEALAKSDQAPLKDKRGALTDAGKIAILAHYAGGNDQKSAMTTFGVSQATARNYWHAHMRSTVAKKVGGTKVTSAAKTAQIRSNSRAAARKAATK